MRWSLALLFAVFLVSATSTCTGTLTPGNHKYTLSVNGTERKYTLHVPPQYDGEAPIPLLFDLHVGLFVGMRRALARSGC